MKHFPVAFFLLILAGIACLSDNAVEVDQVQLINLDTDSVAYLVPVDTIGTETGDSNYVMGAIEGVAFGPDGNIAVLDCGRFCVRVYSPEGQYIRSIGRRGIGPGELGIITFMAVTGDGHIQLAGQSGGEYGAHSFDYYSGEWLGSSRTFIPPSCLEGLDGHRYLRKDITFLVQGEDVYLPVNIAVYETGNEESILTIHSDTVLFDISRELELLELDWYGYDIAAGQDGRVFISPRSTEVARVLVYDSAGMLENTFEFPYEPTRRTEEELDMERNIIRANALASNESPDGLEPDPFKPMIRGLEIDEEGNLWVLQGGPSAPTFSVITPLGEPICTASVDGEPRDGSTWRFHMGENGILAYAEDPHTGYQQIYVLEACPPN